MKFRLKYIILSVFFVQTAFLQIGITQDLHFSQFQVNPLHLNPALSGAFNEDVRFSAAYRRQWGIVPVPYLTIAGNGDMKIPVSFSASGFLGAGMRFLYDRAGDGEMSLAQLAFPISWNQQISPSNYISAGFEMAAYQKAFKLENLTFANQYNGDIFDPARGTGEAFPDQSRYYADLGAGVNWHFEHEDKRHLLDVGLGIFHLNNPKVGFYNQEDIRLPRRWSVFGAGEFELNERLDFLLMGNYQRQGAASEILAGMQLRYFLKPPGWGQVAFQAGSYYRIGDAIIPVLGLQYGVWYAGFSYDITLSDLQTANRSRGGPEFSLVYKITKVKPLKIQKSCPVF